VEGLALLGNCSTVVGRWVRLIAFDGAKRWDVEPAERALASLGRPVMQCGHGHSILSKLECPRAGESTKQQERKPLHQ